MTREYKVVFGLLCVAFWAILSVACHNSGIEAAVSPTSLAAAPIPTVATVDTVATVATPALIDEPAAPAIEQVEPLTPSPTPVYSGLLSPPCGLSLDPLLPPRSAASPAGFGISDATRAELQRMVPAAAWPALQRLLDAPGTVGLVAFQVGREAEGVYLNADAPMPLASVAKLITLVAYAEAVDSEEINPLEQVPLAELDLYYLPNFDLGAHRRAVSELQERGRVASPDDNPTVSLDDVAWMMIRHSSNAAADYLHLRLGQARIEETAIALGLNESPHSHSAPCTFLGQFLVMGNHLRSSADDLAFLSRFAGGDPVESERYGREVALLADAYINRGDFREAEREWRSATRGPAIETQRYFTGQLATQGTAGAYASLMARLAQNGLGSPNSSYQVRRILEWPNVFEANQELFSNVGYKNGSLPGVLTTAYYAYRWDDAAPVIVVLFYRDLPQQTYRRWRVGLPHDELARWLLADPASISILATVMGELSPP